jgi:hypothetical protein
MSQGDIDKYVGDNFSTKMTIFNFTSRTVYDISERIAPWHVYIGINIVSIKNYLHSYTFHIQSSILI